MIVPEPLSVLVLVVLSLTPVVPPVVVVVVEVSCAKAGLNATAPAVPAANSFTNVVCFIFVFALVKRKFSVVLVCDVSHPQFIQCLP